MPPPHHQHALSTGPPPPVVMSSESPGTPGSISQLNGVDFMKVSAPEFIWTLVYCFHALRSGVVPAQNCV